MVLTADGAFVGGGYCEAAFHVTGGNKREQLHEVRWAPPPPIPLVPALAARARHIGPWALRPSICPC